MLQPVGPLPPSVYWRRRVAALAAAVVLLGSLVWGVVTVVGWGGEGTMLADTRPASFAAAEQEQREQARQERERRAADQREQQQREQQERQQPPDPPATPSPPATPPPPALPEDPSTALLGPPTGAARALLPGAVLGTPTPSSPPPPPAVPEPSAAPAPRAAPAPPCPDDALTVTAGSDKPRYAAGERPGFSLVVTNVGDVACTRDLDAARQAVAVVHAPGDGLWSSMDCAAPAVKAPDVRRLAPGETARFSSSWSGRTSLPGCAAPRQVVPPGDYQLLGRLDGIVSEPVPFTLGG